MKGKKEREKEKKEKEKKGKKKERKNKTKQNQTLPPTNLERSDSSFSLSLPFVYGASLRTNNLQASQET